MITRYFGFPRCGKTTTLAKLAITAQRRIDLGLSKYQAVYSNVPIAYPGIKSIKFENLGKMDYHDCVIFIDEGRIFADCRNYKDFDHEKVVYFATHGHDRVDIHIFSHDVNDLDKSIRNCSEDVIYVQKMLMFTRYIRIPRAIRFPELTGEILMGYRAPNLFENIFFGKIYLRRRWYKYFDSWNTYGVRKPVVGSTYPGDPPKGATWVKNHITMPIRNKLLQIRQRKYKKKS